MGFEQEKFDALEHLETAGMLAESSTTKADAKKHRLQFKLKRTAKPKVAPKQKAEPHLGKPQRLNPITHPRQGRRRAKHPDTWLGIIITYFCNFLLPMNAISILAYGVTRPQELVKVIPEIVAVSVAGYSMLVWFFKIGMACIDTVRSYSVLLAAEVVEILGWIVSLVMLAVWRAVVVYKPQPGDPQEWTDKCYDYRSYVYAMDGNGYYHDIDVFIWCKVTVNGQARLIGNPTARLQLRVMIALTSTALVLSSLVSCHVIIVLRKSRR